MWVEVTDAALMSVNQWGVDCETNQWSKREKVSESVNSANEEKTSVII